MKYLEIFGSGSEENGVFSDGFLDQEKFDKQYEEWKRQEELDLLEFNRTGSLPAETKDENTTKAKD